MQPYVYDEESYKAAECFDDYNWTSVIHKFNCSTYVSADDTYNTGYNEKCENYGHLKSKVGFSAIESCCGCSRLPYPGEADHVNENGVIQGGYTGVLTGKVLRVGYPQYSDVNYTFFTNEISVKKGTVPEFMTEVAHAHGFGLVETQISQESTSLFPNDSYAACLSDLSLSRVDICIGT